MVKKAKQSSKKTSVFCQPISNSKLIVLDGTTGPNRNVESINKLDWVIVVQSKSEWVKMDQ